MKKLTALLLVIVLAVCMLASCGSNDPAKKSEGVMTYKEYTEAALDSEVVIEGYVQATQSWWSDKITVYLADLDGAYFLYELACSEADAAKLIPGTKIKVTGTKAAWDGEVEIIPVEYGGNISHFARRQNEPFIGKYYRHNGYSATYFVDGIEGKTDEGDPFTVYRLEWRNPNPEKTIESVTVVDNGNFNTKILLLRLSTI